MSVLPETDALDAPLKAFAASFDGELHTDQTLRTLYATDASAYQELPRAVAIPRSEAAIQSLIGFANTHGVGLIPRTAGTSLAGQVVGRGIVVDVSRHFTRILEINAAEGWVRVQPGVIRNELNLALKPHGLLFGPETSTQNRAMLGGMLGNNSCGSNSLIYGSTRDHTLEVRGFLSDGSEATFGALTPDAFEAKCAGPDEALETRIYRGMRDLLSDPERRQLIRERFPRPEIPRRNTGYALDLLMDSAVYGEGEAPFNLCKLLAGSEGTLFFATEIKLHCDRLPPPASALVCAHFEDVDASLRANLIALEHHPYASELMDHFIFECTKANLGQRPNRFFVQGDPGAVLVVELRGEDAAGVQAEAEAMIGKMRAAGLGYHFPIVTGPDMNRVWELRKAGLGLLSNIPGDAKPVPVVEDTAVTVEDLPEYIRRFNAQLKTYGLECVHYAHAGSGEIHLRPVINLKTPEGNRLFRQVAEDICDLVKQYRGSLSGEHGDGRLRGEFIQRLIGPECYALIEQVKALWDPRDVFNPNKIVRTPPMNASLRYQPGQQTPEPRTYFDWGATEGILRAAELCNGSGDCRKTHLSGGTMCPSYMATRDEKDSTRARANILRNVLTGANGGNAFDSEAIHEVMDLCLSCKGCKRECPSSVDVARMKAEFLQQYHDTHGVPLRSRMIGNFARTSALMSRLPWAWNFIFANEEIARPAKRLVGFAPERSIPLLPPQTLRRWFARHTPLKPLTESKGTVLLFCDEFTNFNDVDIGIAAVELLERLGYLVELPPHGESGRAFLSKGMLKEARPLAEANVEALHPRVSESTPLVGIEPSGILSFRDEYPELVRQDMRANARQLAGHCLMLEEFLAREAEAGRIGPECFTDARRSIKLHGHCFQKALASTLPTHRMLALPANYSVSEIPSGCCGMAGSFGYEQEHYALSMQVGELVLLPAVRQTPADVLVAAPGTSCRHQIKDGTGRRAYHPAEILRQAVR